jgi:putative redox protein
MTEKIMIRQNSRYELEFFSMDPRDPESGELKPVAGLNELTPYGMLLTGLASCTAIVLQRYAENHGFDLERVELLVTYGRVFDDDCDNCEGVERYRDLIQEELRLEGELSDEQIKKLHQIATYCPIHKMLENGVPIESHLVSE